MINASVTVAMTTYLLSGMKPWVPRQFYNTGRNLLISQSKFNLDINWHDISGDLSPKYRYSLSKYEKQLECEKYYMLWTVRDEIYNRLLRKLLYHENCLHEYIMFMFDKRHVPLHYGNLSVQSCACDVTHVQWLACDVTHVHWHCAGLSPNSLLY